MQDLGVCGDSVAADPCDAFSMADVDLFFDNYEDMFSTCQGPSGSSFEEMSPRGSSMGQETAPSSSKHGHMQSIPEAELFKPINVCFLTEEVFDLSSFEFSFKCLIGIDEKRVTSFV